MNENNQTMSDFEIPEKCQKFYDYLLQLVEKYCVENKCDLPLTLSVLARLFCAITLNSTPDSQTARKIMFNVINSNIDFHEIGKKK